MQQAGLYDQCAVRPVQFGKRLPDGGRMRDNHDIPPPLQRRIFGADGFAQEPANPVPHDCPTQPLARHDPVPIGLQPVRRGVKQHQPTALRTTMRPDTGEVVRMRQPEWARQAHTAPGG